jgi:hypothetical protein
MVRHKREGKNYVIKKVKTRDMNPKDLENTENEVDLAFNLLGEVALENQAHKHRCIQGFFRR